MKNKSLIDAGLLRHSYIGRELFEGRTGDKIGPRGQYIYIYIYVCMLVCMYVCMYASCM